MFTFSFKVLVSSALIIFFIAFFNCSNAQSRVHTTNTNAWLMYFGNHKFSSSVGLHAEVQWRRNDFFSNGQQLLLRSGVDYYLKNGVRFTGGYGFIKTYPYGEFAVANAFPEHRVWQQFLFSQSFTNLNLSHRYRLEQRFIGNASTGTMENGRYENRVRYMLKGVIPLNKKAKYPLFLAFYDEVFLNFGKDVGYNLFDQNRLYGALGVTVNSQIKFEVGYLSQIVQLRALDSQGKSRIENNNTIQLAMFHNLSFY